MHAVHVILDGRQSLLVCKRNYYPAFINAKYIQNAIKK